MGTRTYSRRAADGTRKLTALGRARAGGGATPAPAPAPAPATAQNDQAARADAAVQKLNNTVDSYPFDYTYSYPTRPVGVYDIDTTDSPLTNLDRLASSVRYLVERLGVGGAFDDDTVETLANRLEMTWNQLENWKRDITLSGKIMNDDTIDFDTASDRSERILRRVSTRAGFLGDNIIDPASTGTPTRGRQDFIDFGRALNEFSRFIDDGIISGFASVD